MHLTSCLAQALGAYPVRVGDHIGYYPDIEQSVIVRAMEDLRQLYD
jgi:hypothetical protein